MARAIKDLLGRMPSVTKSAERARNCRADGDVPEKGEVSQPVAAELTAGRQGRRAGIRSLPQQGTRHGAGFLRCPYLVHRYRGVRAIAHGQSRPHGVGDTEIIEEGKRIGGFKHRQLLKRLSNDDSASWSRAILSLMRPATSQEAAP